MSKKLMSFSIMLLLMVMAGLPTFADTKLGQNDRYVVRTDGYGTYYIDDTVAGQCMLALRVEKTEERKVYNFFCEGESHRRIKSGIQLAGVIGGYLEKGKKGTKISPIVAWAANVIYDEVCVYFK